MKRKDWITKAIKDRKISAEMEFAVSEGEKVSARREAVEKLCGINLAQIPEGKEVLVQAAGRNIEQAIGVVTIPLGIAGPLVIRGKWARGEYWVPLATTEGALVASLNRGMKAIRLCGGAAAAAEEAGITRSPVFRVRNLGEAKRLQEWVEKNKPKLKAAAAAASRHLQLVNLSIKQVGRSVFIRLEFDTEEAMGMNMVTIASEALVRIIEAETGCRCVSVSSNYCTDKKAAGVNFILGRGKRVRAEVELSEKVISEVLKTNGEDLWEVYFRKICVGSAVGGLMGANGHYANGVAAVFAATGQDLAHIGEGSLGVTTMEKGENGLYVSVYLPDLVVGTVGGGTGLPGQKTALGIMGLGEGKKGGAKELAEIIGGVVLAGEISLLAALASGDLAKAHQRLGRSRKMGKNDKL